MYVNKSKLRSSLWGLHQRGEGDNQVVDADIAAIQRLESDPASRKRRFIGIVVDALTIQPELDATTHETESDIVVLPR